MHCDKCLAESLEVRLLFMHCGGMLFILNCKERRELNEIHKLERFVIMELI